MKLLLYCTKNKWRLFFDKVKQVFTLGKVKSNNELNGKIVAECDFGVEEISRIKSWNSTEDYDWEYETPTLCYYDLLRKSCLMCDEFEEYIEFNGYAIHIKNLHIFDKTKELDYYYSRPKKVNTFDWYRLKGYTYANISLDKAPQNMMYCCSESGKDYILISIRPEYLVDILNGEKTIEVRKKVLKEMLNNV